MMALKSTAILLIIIIIIITSLFIEDYILIAILCNHFTFYIGGSARVVSDFSQTFSVCVLSHKNM